MAEPAVPEEEAEEGADAAKPKGGKKGLIIAVVVAVVLAGGGFAAFKLLGGKEDPAKKKETVKTELVPPRYVTLDPPFVVNFEAESAVRFLQVTVGLMTRDLEIEKLVKENDPRIRNDLLLILGNQPYAALSTREGKEDLRKSCLETVRTVIKESGAEPDKLEALYFTSFVMQ